MVWPRSPPPDQPGGEREGGVHGAKREADPDTGAPRPDPEPAVARHRRAGLIAMAGSREVDEPGVAPLTQGALGASQRGEGGDAQDDRGDQPPSLVALRDAAADHERGRARADAEPTVRVAAASRSRSQGDGTPAPCGLPGLSRRSADARGPASVTSPRPEGVTARTATRRSTWRPRRGSSRRRGAPSRARSESPTGRGRSRRTRPGRPARGR